MYRPEIKLCHIIAKQQAIFNLMIRLGILMVTN